MAEYIEREALLNKLKERDLCLCVTERDIKDAPAADVAPVVHGQWEYNKNAGTYQCQNCCSVVHERYEVFDLEANEESDLHFCPNCGAKMDSKEETNA